MLVIDHSDEAEGGEMGGDRLGSRSGIPEWSACNDFTSKSTSTSGIGGEYRAMPKSSVLSLMREREASRGESVIQRRHGGPVLRRSRRGTTWARSAGV